MTSETEAAGRRIIEVNRELKCQYSVSDENDESICHCEDYESAEYIARVLIRDERETDFRPVDEAFAKNVAVRISEDDYAIRYNLPSDDVAFILFRKRIGNVSLEIIQSLSSSLKIADPTIGDFHKACALFGITLTPTGASQ